MKTYFVYSAYAGTPYTGHVQGTFAYHRTAENFLAALQRGYEQRVPNTLHQYTIFAIAFDRGHGPYRNRKPCALTV